MKESDLHSILAEAGVDPATLGPFAALVAACFAAAKAGAQAAELSLSLPIGTTFEPWRAYSADEAASFLGLKKRDSVYEIPEFELPRVRVGPKRGSIGFLGADLLCYAKGLRPIDYDALREQFTDRLRRPAPTTLPLPGRAGKKRLL